MTTIPLYPQDWIGLPFGSKVSSKNGQAHLHLLAPTPELWTLVLRHRTQILYVADIAIICARLELRPGSIVLESGTGSGSLTHALARGVAPSGRVHTFDFHDQRVAEAAKEFAQHGLSAVVEIAHRDIEQHGFPEELHGRADAVFLDLPRPWEVVPSAAACLRPDGVFCGFSPCIEQVQSTAAALNRHGFRDIATCEVLLREFEVPKSKGWVKTLREVLTAQQRAKEENGGLKKRGRHLSNGNLSGRHGTGNVPEDKDDEPANKRQKTDERSISAQPETIMDTDADTDTARPVVDANAGDLAGTASVDVGERAQQDGAENRNVMRRVLAKPVQESKGHTGFLTFARRIVPL
jgi:tRNA (adenine57-N1/adenine58-N1)-methyltransferase catalytic subunit